MKHLKTFLFSLFAGFSIGLGGTLNLICRSEGYNILGGILFSVGLLLICFFGFNLFTGKVGYFFAERNKLLYLRDLAIFYVGNFVGAVGLGYTMRLVNHNFVDETSELAIKTLALGEHKLVALPGMPDGVGIPWYSLFILSIFCGIMVFLAVELFKRETTSPIIKIVGIVISVGGFVIAGFEHCIADMYYLSASGLLFSQYSGSAFLSILLGSSGNIIGALFTWYTLNHLPKKA